MLLLLLFCWFLETRTLWFQTYYVTQANLSRIQECPEYVRFQACRTIHDFSLSLENTSPPLKQKDFYPWLTFITIHANLENFKQYIKSKCRTYFNNQDILEEKEK